LLLLSFFLTLIIMNKDIMLRISAVLLSFIVLAESISIAEKIKYPSNFAAQPDVFLGEIVADDVPRISASLWLESKKIDEYRYQLTLWIDSTVSAQTVRAKMYYNTEDIEIMDQIATISGIQAQQNTDWNFILNQIASESGSIEILAKKEILNGRHIVASISASKKRQNLTDISFDYIANTREGSYVSALDTGENILQKPGIISF